MLLCYCWAHASLQLPQLADALRPANHADTPCLICYVANAALFQAVSALFCYAPAGVFNKRIQYWLYQFFIRLPQIPTLTEFCLCEAMNWQYLAYET